jgi:hypothetical protein
MDAHQPSGSRFSFFLSLRVLERVAHRCFYHLISFSSGVEFVWAGGGRLFCCFLFGWVMMLCSELLHYARRESEMRSRKLS